MNKKDIINNISKLLLSKKVAAIVVNKIFEEILFSLKNGEKVIITKFGSFNVFKTKIKKGRNPKSGEKLFIGPMKKIKFKQSKNIFKNDKNN
jgi:nucleoid DNA-binding protein